MFTISEFVTSLTAYSSPLSDSTPEIAVVGRSNVGKSSFINMLCNRRNLARISGTPGKTRLINIFKIGYNVSNNDISHPATPRLSETCSASLAVCKQTVGSVAAPLRGRGTFGELFLVDLPGYGYQAKTKSEAEKWAPMIEKYLTGSKNLKLVILLVDIRHSPSVLDVEMSKYLHFHQIPYIVVATKSDKIAKTRVKEHLQVLDKGLGIGVDNITPVSNETGYNRDKVIEILHRYAVK
jgi:GTP-binding protein